VSSKKFAAPTEFTFNAKRAEPRPISHAANRHARAKRHGLIDGIVDGERVVIATPNEREKGIEIRIRVALAAAGVLVWKHHVDNRSGRTGIAIGASDLICVVPPFGRFLGIEVKRPGYSPSRVRTAQTRWLAVVARFGGVSGIATSVEEAMALVELARRIP
jgi:hypothetical protein